jgi:hypothetical protein
LSQRNLLPAMKILAQSRIGMFSVLLAASSALFAQTSGSAPARPQNHASALDARQIMELSVAAAERNWQARDRYTFMQLNEDRRLDSRGQVKSEDTEISKMILVNGARFDQLIERNGHPPSAEEQRKSGEDLDKLQHETPQERTVRLGKEQDDRAFFRDVLEGFDFHLVGEEIVDGRPAYVIEATPHPGYHAPDKYGRLLSNVEGKLWVDKQDFGWVKADGEVTQAFSLGLFVARVQRGSHIVLQQTSVGDAVWLPQRIELRASARILFLRSLDVDRVLTFSDYLLVADDPYSASR